MGNQKRRRFVTPSLVWTRKQEYSTLSYTVLLLQQLPALAHSLAWDECRAFKKWARSEVRFWKAKVFLKKKKPQEKESERDAPLKQEIDFAHCGQFSRSTRSACEDQPFWEADFSRSLLAAFFVHYVESFAALSNFERFLDAASPKRILLGDGAGQDFGTVWQQRFTTRYGDNGRTTSESNDYHFFGHARCFREKEVLSDAVSVAEVDGDEFFFFLPLFLP